MKTRQAKRHAGINLKLCHLYQLRTSITDNIAYEMYYNSISGNNNKHPIKISLHLNLDLNLGSMQIETHSN